MKSLLPLAAVLLVNSTALPASGKPCLDEHGEVVKCSKKPAPPRCKDDKGRFVSCGPKAKK